MQSIFVNASQKAFAWPVASRSALLAYILLIPMPASTLRAFATCAPFVSPGRLFTTDFQLRQYSSSHSRISKTFVQFTIIVIPKIRISNDSVMRSFFLLGYPSNMCAVQATWPLVDESLSSLIPLYSISITHTLDSSYILTRYELINTFSLRSLETFQ